MVFISCNVAQQPKNNSDIDKNLRTTYTGIYTPTGLESFAAERNPKKICDLHK